MDTRLTQDEDRYLHDLLVWDTRQRSVESVFQHAALFLGGIVIVGSILFALRDLTDRAIYGMLVPGILVGLFFVSLYVYGRIRTRERHRLASIARKLIEGP
jgi:hypothetical protein